MGNCKKPKLIQDVEHPAVNRTLTLERLDEGVLEGDRAPVFVRRDRLYPLRPPIRHFRPANNLVGSSVIAVIRRQEAFDEHLIALHARNCTSTRCYNATVGA